MRLLLRPDIATVDTDDGMVLLNQRSGRYWQLNNTGAHLLRQLLQGLATEEAAADLATRYHVALPLARDDVATLVTRLRAAELVEPA